MMPGIRLVKLEIENIKNVQHGRLELPNKKNGSILGIYGQNGSGKTVVVDCMVLLKCLLSGRQIPSRFYYYINALKINARVLYGFEIETGSAKIYAEYEVRLLKMEKNSFCIDGEVLWTREIVEGKRTRLTPIFEYHRGEKELFRPLKYYARFAKDIKSMIALGIAQQATENYNEEKNISEVGSFLFSRKAQEVFEKAKGEERKIFSITNLLSRYGKYDLEVIENSHYGLLALDLDSIWINVDLPDAPEPKISGIMLALTDVNVVPKEVFLHVEDTITQINTVMKALIPDLRIEIYNLFEKLTENGQDGVHFEIITVRGDARIPLLYESAGVKKLISICSNLVACYNRESYCLVVDELDSGIYEYLLGECLEVMEKKARGQLIFTSHNLRPLEVLENGSLIYTTVNPENRYIRSSYIKNTQNMRLSYLRSVKLGGQKEKLYNETNIYEMELAMRRAGRRGISDFHVSDK